MRTNIYIFRVSVPLLSNVKLLCHVPTHRSVYIFNQKKHLTIVYLYDIQCVQQ